MSRVDHEQVALSKLRPRFCRLLNHYGFWNIYVEYLEE